MKYSQQSRRCPCRCRDEEGILDDGDSTETGVVEGKTIESTHFLNASTALTMTSLPRHNTSTLTSSTVSRMPTDPMFGLAPPMGKKCPVPGVSKQALAYLPPGYVPAPVAKTASLHASREEVGTVKKSLKRGGRLVVVVDGEDIIDVVLRFLRPGVWRIGRGRRVLDGVERYLKRVNDSPPGRKGEGAMLEAADVDFFKKTALMAWDGEQLSFPADVSDESWGLVDRLHLGAGPGLKCLMLPLPRCPSYWTTVLQYYVLTSSQAPSYLG